MVNCVECLTAIGRSKSVITCESCKNCIHAACVSKTLDILAAINAVPGLFWRCKDCVKSCISIRQSDIGNFLESKVDAALCKIENHITSLKTNFVRRLQEPIVQVKPTPYADIVKNKTKPAVVIKPKNENQAVSQTKSDLMRNINPAEHDFHLTRVKHLKDGGILVGCRSGEENDKLKKLVEEKMANSYKIREFAGVEPRLRVVGLSEEYSGDVLLALVLKCNPETFCGSYTCKIVKIFPTKKSPNIYQAVIQVDRICYDKLMKAGNLFVGYDSCRIFDAIDILRCYNCNGYHHSSKGCKKDVTCPLCAHKHELKDCKSSERKCTNCVKLVSASESVVSVSHAVWEREKCTSYKAVLKKFRDDLLGPA